MKIIRFVITAIVLCALLIGTAYSQRFDDQFKRIHTLLNWKYYDDALIQLDNIIDTKEEPYVSRAKLIKGVCYLNKKYPEEAKTIFQELINSKYILNDYSLYFLANYYFDANKYEIAKDYYNALVSTFPNSALARISQLKEASCSYKLNRYQNASELYKDYTVSYPAEQNIDEAIFALANCYEKIGKMGEAFNEYNKITLYYPLCKNLTKASKRVRYLSKMYGLRPIKETDRVFFDKAMLFYDKQDYNSAAYFLRQVIKNKYSKFYDEALFRLAFCDYRQRRFKTAITRFSICINRGGQFADAAQFFISFAYGRRGYFYNTISALEKVVNNYPGSSYIDDAIYYLGYYNETNGFTDKSLGYYEKLINTSPNSTYRDETLWRIGKIRYSRGEFDLALAAFDKVVTTMPTSSMCNECAYWKALTLEKMDRKIESTFAYQHVIQRFDHTYYSHRARAKLKSLGIIMGEYEDKDMKIADFEFEKGFFETAPYKNNVIGQIEPYPLEVSYDENKAMRRIKKEPRFFSSAELEEHFEKYSELMSVKLFIEAKIEADWLVAHSPDDRLSSSKLAVSAALLGAGKYRESIVLAEIMCDNSIINGNFRELPKITWYLSYPKGYYEYVGKYSEKYGIDPYLVLAVIREESRFNPGTLSWAKAHGLMQLIPRTGNDVARLLRIRPYYSNRLYDPETNINMGCYYLSNLMKKFNNNKTLALAAYNGGPNNVARWLNACKKKYGESFSLDEANLDEFIENIPLSETRRYVKKVLKSYNEYKRIYQERAFNLTDYVN